MSTNESQIPSNGGSQNVEQCDKFTSVSQMPSCTHSPVSQLSSIPGVSLSTDSCVSSMSRTTGQHVQDVIGVAMNSVPVKCGVTNDIPVLNSDVSQSIGQFIPSRTVTSSLPHSNPVSQTHAKYKSSSAPSNLSQDQNPKSYLSGNHSKVVPCSDSFYSNSYGNSLSNPMSRSGLVPRVSSVVSRPSRSNCHSVVSSSQDVRNIPMFQSHLVPSGNLDPISSTRVFSNHRPISSTHVSKNYQHSSFVPDHRDYPSSSFNPVSNNYPSSRFTPVSNNYQSNSSAYVSNDHCPRNSHLAVPSSGPSADTSIMPSAQSHPVQHLTASVHDSSVFNQNQSYLPSHNLTGDASGNPVNTSSSGSSSSLHPSIVYQMSGRPPPEPAKFNGESIWSYPSWRTSFSALVNKAGISLEDKMSYLQTYLEGEALRCIQGSLMFPSEEAYHKAIRRLDQRYGDPYAISSAFRSRLDKWSKIASNDGRSLRHLSDFLNQCSAAQAAYDDIGMFVDNFELTKIACKLPDFLRNKWVRYSRDTRLKQQHTPGLSEFVEFVEKEADVACDIANSYQQDRVDNKSYKVHSHAVDTSRSENPTGSAYKLSCILCKDSHLLDICPEFLKKSVEDRFSYVFQNRLCYSCLKSNHSAKFCKRRSVCTVCKHSHPTSLHGGRPPRYNAPAQPKVLVEQLVTAKTDCEEVDIPDDQSTVSHLASSTCLASRVTNDDKCGMIVPVYVCSESCPDNEELVYCLLDSQSDSSFISGDVCKKLHLSETPVTLSLSTLGKNNQAVPSSKVNNLLVRGYNRNEYVKVSSLYTRDEIPINKNHIPTPEKVINWPHLSFLSSELMPLSNCPVGLLIGYDTAKALMPLRVVPSPGDSAFGLETALGWGLVGLIKPRSECDDVGYSHHSISYPVETDSKSVTRESCFVYKTHVKEMLTPQAILDIMNTDFATDQSSDFVSHEDRRFLKLMNDNVKCINSRYELPLPFKSGECPLLPDNRGVAFHRLVSLKNKLISNEKHCSDYCGFMDKLLANKHAEIVSDPGPYSNSLAKHWYLPHHSVYNGIESKRKIRVVFDASSSCKGISLNDTLMQGPDMTNSLLGVLCRFRKEKVAIMCDVSQMFFNFEVTPDHRDYFRFLWYQDNDFTKSPTHYRFTVHVFGAKSSPSVANFGLKQVANDFEFKYGQSAADFIRHSFYVDDGLISVATVEEAIELIKTTRALCREGSLTLHKFVSNFDEVLSKIGESDNSLTCNKDLPGCDLVEKALGINWNMSLDSFTFQVKLKHSVHSRRNILSTICSIYDPLGFISPYILPGRIILQNLCKSKLDWDDKIPMNILVDYEHWLSSLEHLSNVSVPRCYKPDAFGTVKRVELHSFSDASMVGYGQCSYLRLIDDHGVIHCSLVLGKSRVCPLKAVTIPRLELVAALMSLRISLRLIKELPYTNIERYYWTDSKVVLGYLANETRRFHTYVANRAQEIRECSDINQWFHVKTSDNPADMASRGLDAREISSHDSWFHGPRFLWEPLKNLVDSTTCSYDENDPEVRKVVVHSLETVVCNEDFSRYSNWNLTVRVIATCLRFIAILRNRCKVKCKRVTRSQSKLKVPPIAVEDMRNAEIAIIRSIQSIHFESEMQYLSSISTTGDKEKSCVSKTSSLYKLNPFIDKMGLLRVGGRLHRSDLPYELKHPVVLPHSKKCHVSWLLIKHFHDKIAHQGRGMTINAIRAGGFWILSCASAVASFLHKCVTCRKHFQPMMTQVMADLPNDRISGFSVFTHTGVDVFGPWLVREGRKELKRYGILFTCMSCRAVHLETLNSMNTDSFINALRRFIAIRGPVKVLRSDCGTNFVGANNQLKKEYQNMNFDKIKSYLLSRSCDLITFKMNVPHASHFGGSWERQIRSVRRVLTVVLSQNSTRLNDEGLRTFMCEVAAIVNSRPLTVETLSDVNSPAPLTPNNLLTMKAEVVLPPPGNFEKQDLFCLRLWKRVQYLSNQFYNLYRKEVLSNLQSRSKWVKPQRNLKVGDIVLLKDENTPRCEWLTSVVTEVFVSEDNKVRSATVRLASCLDNSGKRLGQATFLSRPISKLVLLLESQVPEQ